MQLSTFMILLAFTLGSAYAWKGCKLNEYGQNICADELALLRQDRSIQVVTVKDHKEDYTVVEFKSKKYRAELNNLIGNRACDNYYDLCRQSRAFIKRNCISALANRPVKVVESFENNMALVQVANADQRLLNTSCLTY